MASSQLASSVVDKFNINVLNKVTPAEMFEQPRQSEISPTTGHKGHGDISVFMVVDEPQFSRLWYSNESRIFPAAAVHWPHENFEKDVTDASTSTLGDSSVPTNDGISYDSRLHSSQISTHDLSEQSCSHNISSNTIHVENALSNTNGIVPSQSYIHLYLNVMYLFCMSAVRLNKSQPTNSGILKNWSRWIASHLQLGIFTLFAFLSVFQSFCQAKYDMLWFLFEGGLNQFVKFSFNVTSLVTSAFCSYSFCKDWETVKEMFNVMSSNESSLSLVSTKPAFCTILAFITALIALLKSLFTVDIMDISVENAMLDSSYQLSEDLFLWSSHNLNISIQKIDEEFGSDLNSITISLALVKVLRDFSYYLQDGMLWDLIICVVATLFCWMKIYMQSVTKVVDNVLDENSEEWRALQRQRELVWNMYREIRNVFEAVNNVFDPLLIFFHASNVLRYAFFMENLIYPENVDAIIYVHLLYNIVKSEIIYMVASRIAQQNKIIRKWLRNWGSPTGKIDVGLTKIDLTAALDELDEEPLGLGK